MNRPSSARPSKRGAPSTLGGREDAIDSNVAPSQWGRRLARLVGEKYGVKMSENMSKNEGTWRKKAIAIKCAKSLMPPVSVLTSIAGTSRCTLGRVSHARRRRPNLVYFY